MSQRILRLFSKYKEAKRRKEQAWDRVFAAPNNKASEVLAKKAKEFDKKLYNIMAEINRLSAEEALEVRRKIRKAKKVGKR